MSGLILSVGAAFAQKIPAYPGFFIKFLGGEGSSTKGHAYTLDLKNDKAYKITIDNYLAEAMKEDARVMTALWYCLDLSKLTVLPEEFTVAYFDSKVDWRQGKYLPTTPREKEIEQKIIKVLKDMGQRELKRLRRISKQKGESSHLIPGPRMPETPKNAVPRFPKFELLEMMGNTIAFTVKDKIGYAVEYKPVYSTFKVESANPTFDDFMETTLLKKETLDPNAIPRDIRNKAHEVLKKSFKK